MIRIAFSLILKVLEGSKGFGYKFWAYSSWFNFDIFFGSIGTPRVHFHRRIWNIFSTFWFMAFLSFYQIWLSKKNKTCKFPNFGKIPLPMDARGHPEFNGTKIFSLRPFLSSWCTFENFGSVNLTDSQNFYFEGILTFFISIPMFSGLANWMPLSELQKV